MQNRNLPIADSIYPAISDKSNSVFSNRSRTYVDRSREAFDTLIRSKCTLRNHMHASIRDFGDSKARFEDAIDSLRRLASAIGPHPDVLNYLGYAYRRLERYEQAETYYEQALTIDPLHRGANEYLGEMYVELGRLDEARARLAVLDEACPFACAEYEDLERVLEQRVVAAQ